MKEGDSKGTGGMEGIRECRHRLLGEQKKKKKIQRIDQLMNAYYHIGCRLSLKIHMLFCHLDLFSENMGEISEEAGERSHQHSGFRK